MPCQGLVAGTRPATTLPPVTYNSKDAGTKVFLALIKATGFVGCAVMKSGFVQ